MTTFHRFSIACCAALISASALADSNRHGTLLVQQSFTADLDNGVVSAAGAEVPGADLWFHAVDQTNMFLEPRNGAFFNYTGKQATTTGLGFPPDKYCKNRRYPPSKTPLPLSALSPGMLICVTTSEGRRGYFTVSVSHDTPYHKPRIARISYVLWP